MALLYTAGGSWSSHIWRFAGIFEHGEMVLCTYGTWLAWFHERNAKRLLMAGATAVYLSGMALGLSLWINRTHVSEGLGVNFKRPIETGIAFVNLNCEA